MDGINHRGSYITGLPTLLCQYIDAELCSVMIGLPWDEYVLYFGRHGTKYIPVYIIYTD